MRQFVVTLLVLLIGISGVSLAASNIDSIKDLQKDMAVEEWGKMTSKQARQIYLEQTPALLEEIYTNVSSLNEESKKYLSGKLPKTDMLKKLSDIGFYSSQKRNKAYLLLSFMPKDQKIKDLHTSLAILEADVGNIGLTIKQAIDAGQRSSLVNMYLDSFNKDYPKTMKLLRELLADYRVASPKAATTLEKRINVIDTKIKAIL